MFKLMITITIVSAVSSHPYQSTTTTKPDAIIYIDARGASPRPTIRPPHDDLAFNTYAGSGAPHPGSYPSGNVVSYQGRTPSQPGSTRSYPGRPATGQSTARTLPASNATSDGHAPHYGYVYALCQPYCRVYRRRYVLPICYPV